MIKTATPEKTETPDMTDTPVTLELAEKHGLTCEEYEKILQLIGRVPSLTELGIFSAMWNEHCSYKSSKVWLKTLPTAGKRVIYGPGENAGVVDIDDGQVAVFKMESHNHPSFIEPFQGAATGVGGILRDVFTMGARPIAALNALRFGSPDHPKTKHLFSQVVAGIANYGNSFGVPTVGGEINFHPRFNGNILVNAMAVGVADRNKIFTSEAERAELSILYFGAKTGRDGIHGATMASAEFDDKTEEKRPAVQVGDPFTEKKLLEASLELMHSGAVAAIQDMGAAGLTCSAVEPGAKGDLGVCMNLDLVPVREEKMTAYEIMLSESQERMLAVIYPEHTETALAILKKHELDAAIIGKTTKDKRFKIYKDGKLKADLPIKELGDEAPVYNRPYVIPIKGEMFDKEIFRPEISDREALLKLLACFNGCSRQYVAEQYDSLVGGNTVQTGGDAAVVRVPSKRNPHKGLAMTTDVTPRYCESNPELGGSYAVAEARRNLCAVGAEPIAITDNLNFGNPQKLETAGQAVGCVRGIAKACEYFSFPVVSGNVSLYNETAGIGILPVPAIGAVGLVKDIRNIASIGFKRDRDSIYLIGVSAPVSLGCSLYLSELYGQENHLPAPLDLEAELKNGDFIRTAVADGILDTVHDISDGGMSVALAEMCMAGNRGARIDLITENKTEELFAEGGARYLVAVPDDLEAEFLERAENDDVLLFRLGVTRSEELVIGKDFFITLEEMKAAHSATFYDYLSNTR